MPPYGRRRPIRRGQRPRLGDPSGGLIGPPQPVQQFGTRPSFGDPSGGIIHDPYGMPIMGGGGGTPKPGMPPLGSRFLQGPNGMGPWILPPKGTVPTGPQPPAFHDMRWRGDPRTEMLLRARNLRDINGPTQGLPPGPVPLDFLRAAFAARRRGF